MMMRHGTAIELAEVLKFTSDQNQNCPKHIGVDLAALLHGGRMASAEGGSVPRGVEYGEGCPLSSRLRGLGERREPKTDFGVF